MDRFFEVKDRIQDLKPINTNVHIGIDKISLIIVCESPSEDEVDKGYPTVSATGTKIFNHLVRSRMIESDDKYTFDDNYDDFEKNGIYLTNLVRYQADAGIKGDRGKKDKKIRELWRLTKKQLFSELTVVAKKFPNVKILFSCGAAFEPQLKEATKFVNSLKIDWFITSHPSRSERQLSNNYNPDYWCSSDIIKTELMKKVEQYHARRANKAIKSDT